MDSLRYTDEEQAKRGSPYPERLKPEFPEEMCFTLTERECEICGIDSSEAELWGEFVFRGKGRIKHVSHTEGPDGKAVCCIRVQTEEFEIESQEEEEEGEF